MCYRTVNDDDGNDELLFNEPFKIDIERFMGSRAGLC